MKVMILVVKLKNYVIYNVVLDGNCMFVVIVD